MQDQYDRYVTAITIGARHIQQNTNIEIEVTAYDDTTNLVHARTIPAPWPGNPHSHDFTCPPATLAGDGYRLAPAKPTATSTPQR